MIALEFEDPWFVACIEPRRERRAEQELRNDGWETFLPLETKWVRRGRWKRRQTVPLLPGYLFTRFLGQGSPQAAIRGVDGVRGILSANGRPTPLQASAFAHLREACFAGLFDETTEVLRLSPGSVVRLVNHPLAGFAARLKAIRGRKRVELAMSFLGSDRSIVVPIESVRAA